MNLLARLTVLALAIPMPAVADTPGHHPHYLHALSDLRYARFLLAGQHQACHSIDRAMEEMKHAAIDDHKYLNDHPPADRTWNRAARLRKASELIESALRDLNYEEDNRAARGWRDRAIQNTQQALEFTRQAMAVR